MTIQYSEDNGWSTWLDLFKQNIVEVSNEINGLFDLINSGKIDPSKVKDWNGLFNKKGIAESRDELKEFFTTAYQGGDVSEEYRKWMIANGKATSTFTGFTKKASTALKSLGAAMGSMLVMWAVGEAISFAVQKLDEYANSAENTTNALEESFSAFEESISTIEEYNSELATTSERISELQKLADLGTISIADEAELKTLKKQNDELERKIILEKQEQALAAKQLLKDLDAVGAKNYDFYYGNGHIGGFNSKQSAVDALQGYINQYDWWSGTNNDTVTEADILKSEEGMLKAVDAVYQSIDAYETLIEQGYKLTDVQKGEYTQLVRVRDNYLLHNYNLNNTIDSYRALNEEQQKNILLNKLRDKGLKEDQALAVIENVDVDQYDELWNTDFSFTPPAMKDNTSAEEYGKAYAEAWLNAIQETIDKTNKTEDLKNFSDVFNAESFKDASKTLKELAISGELSPETLMSTKEYITLLEQTGLTAEEAIEKIRGIAIAESSLSDVMGSMSSLAKLMNEVTSEIADSGQLSFDTLQSIASKYPTLEKYVTDYLNGVEGAEERLVTALQEQYNRDLDNYREYYSLKQENDEKWYTNYITNTSSWVTDLAKQYGIDLKNYGSYLEAKSALEKAIEDAKATTTKQTSSDSFTAIGVDGTVNTGISDLEKQSAEQEVENLQKILDDIIATFNDSISAGNDLLSDFASTDYVGGNDDDSSSSSVDAHKEAFNKAYADLKHMREMDLISDAEYYAELDKLNKEYFADREEYLDEYRQYEEEVHKGLLSVQEDSLNAINKLINLRVDMIKDAKEEEIKAIEEAIEAEKERLKVIKEQIDARRKAIEISRDEEDHESELAERNESIADIQSQIDALEHDDSASGQKKRRKLEEQLVEEQKDLADYISDYETDKALEALDEEERLAEEASENKQKELDEEIEDIRKFLDDEKKLIEQAISDITGMNSGMYDDMKKWARETTGSVWEVVEAWKAAEQALKTYNGTNNISKTIDTLNQNSIDNIVTPPTTYNVSYSNSNNSADTNKPTTPSSNANDAKTEETPSYKAIHTIKDGDTLSELAEYYYGDSSKWKKIQAANNNIDPKKLRVGKQLIIPYAKGTKSVPYDLLALVDELGDELKLHAGKSGKLEVLTKGSSVVPADLTENLMKWGEISPASFKFDIPDYTKAFKGIGSNMVVNVGDININGDMGNLTVSDLNKFRKDLAYDVMDIMNKNRTKSGRY